jgi:ATP-dependent exoDNAse (exonuclease V) beta subunit
VHRALEHIDLRAEAQEALAPALVGLEASLASLVDSSALPAALADAQDVLTSCWGGALGGRLRSLGEAVVARELDFIAPPSEVDGSRPLHYLTGAIDLVYLDPDDGGFVVADFKTDRVSGDSQIAERAASYRGQIVAYARAVQHALDLSELPRAELWFLRADVVVPVADEY